jgi:predicted DNA-binding transcriptional regulator AlpA
MRALLTIRDLKALLQVSESTLRRWLAATRAGTGNFPWPINGFGKKLLFRPEDIEAWIAAGRQQQQVPNFESASQRSKRHTAALKSLKQKGVKINN